MVFAQVFALKNKKKESWKTREVQKKATKLI